MPHEPFLSACQVCNVCIHVILKSCPLFSSKSHHYKAYTPFSFWPIGCSLAVRAMFAFYFSFDFSGIYKLTEIHIFTTNLFGRSTHSRPTA